MSAAKTPSAAACRRACAEMDRLIEPRLFRALSDPNRIAILVRLAGCTKPCTVSEVAACCPVNISVVSRHLAALREAGLLSAEKHGKEVHYRLCCSHVIHLLRGLADALETCCQHARPCERKTS